MMNMEEAQKQTFGVHNVIVYSRTEIGFAMKCGLTLRERI